MVPYLPPRATWYQQTMLFTFISRTCMKILKDPDSSMDAFVGLLVTSLPQDMTSSYSFFCLLINYLSMWDPCFWLYGCFISLNAAAMGTCFWKVQVYHRNFISLIFLTCLGNFSRAVHLDFPLWSPKCYIYLYITNRFIYSSFYLFALESFDLLVHSLLVFSRFCIITSAPGWFLIKRQNITAESLSHFILEFFQNSCLNISCLMICWSSLCLPL